jgi:hypothetical protein
VEPLLNWAISYHLARPLEDLHRSYGVWGSQERTYVDTLLQACYLTARKWKEDPVRAANLDWIWFIRPSPEQTADGQFPRPAEFDVGLQRWDSTAETEAEAEQRLRATCNAAIRTMLDKQRQEAQRLGGRPVPRRYDRKHFDWLVLYQVARQGGASAIGRAAGESRQTVEMGIKRAAEILVGRNYRKWLR